MLNKLLLLTSLISLTLVSYSFAQQMRLSALGEETLEQIPETCPEEDVYLVYDTEPTAHYSRLGIYQERIDSEESMDEVISLANYSMLVCGEDAAKEYVDHRADRYTYFYMAVAGIVLGVPSFVILIGRFLRRPH